MLFLEREFKQYLKETLDISVHLKNWKGESGLPFFLQKLYAFFQVSILDTLCLVIVPKEEEEQTPGTICKHIAQLQKHWGHEIIYASRKMSPYNRKRLIEHKVSFVVPGNQMYLPHLGVDLRDHFKAIRNTLPKWSPSTQVVFLYIMNNFEQELTPKKLANRLGYTHMSMSRAFNELESAELVQIIRKGRQRVLRLDQDRKLLWEKAIEFLRTPVKKRIWVRSFSNELLGVEAGLTALSRYSMLSEPANPVFAVKNKYWIKYREDSSIMEVPMREPDSCQLEIWIYPPTLFAQNNVVDRFSLYLSLKDTEEERVELALEEMMEHVQW